MTLEDDKHVVRRFLEELFGAGNLNLLDELVASNAVHIPVNKAISYGWEPGREGFSPTTSFDSLSCMPSCTKA